eukprot:scaffold21700_cov164-Amphora_coffeaeformis.AAC.7
MESRVFFPGALPSKGGQRGRLTFLCIANNLQTETRSQSDSPLHQTKPSSTYSPYHTIAIKDEDVHLIQKFPLRIRKLHNIGVERHTRRRKGPGNGAWGKGPGATGGETGENRGCEFHVGFVVIEITLLLPYTPSSFKKFEHQRDEQ